MSEPVRFVQRSIHPRHGVHAPRTALLTRQPGSIRRTVTIDTFRPGDILVLYTDGVIEIMNDAGEMFGLDRLEDVIRRCPGCLSRDIVEAVVGATRAFAGRAGYEDDFTLVIIRRNAGASGTAG